MLNTFFETIGWENLLLICIFMISLTFLKFALKKTFDKGTSNILSVVIALLITGGLYFSGLDVQGGLISIGIGEDIITTIVPLILVIGIIYLLFKYKSKFFLIAGIVFILLAMFKLVYETTIMWILGIVCLFIGLLLWWKGKKKEKINNPNDKVPWWRRGRNNSPNNPPNNAPQIIEKKRERSLLDLKQKYIQYVYMLNRSDVRNDDHKRKEIKNIMRTIINTAKNQGCSEGKFLSSSIGGTNTRPPEGY